MIFEHTYHQPPDGGASVEMIRMNDCGMEIPYIPDAYDGETVIFSVWCLADGDGTISVSLGELRESVDVGASWTRIAVHASDFEIGDKIIITAGASVEAYFYKAQLETGTKMTDWSPAPEDAEAGVIDAQASAESAQEAADAAYDALDNRITLDAEGMHIGKLDDGADRRNEILIRTGSNPTIDFMFDGTAESSIAKDYHRFGNMEIRVPRVGGFVFQAVEEGE